MNVPNKQRGTSKVSELSKLVCKADKQASRLKAEFLS